MTPAAGTRDILRALGARWLTIVATTLAGTVAALGYSLLATPVYQATTRFFVSAEATSASDVYQSNLASQQRVASYSELLVGRALAKRVIDQLGLPFAPEDLIGRIDASSRPNTVLIDAMVSDTSPARARDIAASIAEQFPDLVDELETPPDGGTASATVSVAEEPEMPTAPVSPKSVRNVGLGLTIGLLLGIITAIVRDRMDNTVTDRTALAAATDSVPIGSIPYDRKIDKAVTGPFRTSTAPVAEAYREVRMNLRLLSVDNPPKVIVVTSAVAGEGKSTTALGLAQALAEQGHRVVVVDGDLRRPRLAVALGVVGAAVVSSVLAHEATLDEVVQPSEHEDVWVLVSGPVPPNPSELLGSAAARSMLADLRAAFDYVVIDSPPVLPVTDGAVLATEADGAILVTRHGATPKDDVAHAAAKLDTVGATLLGVVLTGVPHSGRRDRYGYSYTSAPVASTDGR